jgi:hypothetical protein
MSLELGNPAYHVNTLTGDRGSLAVHPDQVQDPDIQKIRSIVDNLYWFIRAHQCAKKGQLFGISKLSYFRL